MSSAIYTGNELMQRTSEIAVLSELKQSAGHPIQYGVSVGLFLEHAEHVIEVSRRLQHVLSQPEVLIRTRALLFSLHTFTPLVLCAAQALHTFIGSSIAAQHYLLCADAWIQAIQDVRKILSEITLHQLHSSPTIPSLPITINKAQPNHNTFPTTNSVMPIESNSQYQSQPPPLHRHHLSQSDHTSFVQTQSDANFARKQLIIN